jgi:Tfp pilus assembly PilM family ATPase
MSSFDFKKIKFLSKKQVLNDALGVYLTTDSIALLRLKKIAGVVSISDAEIFDHDALLKNKGDSSITSSIPNYFKAKYASVAYSSENALIKLLNFPRVVDSRNEKQIAADLGLEEAETYRLGYTIVPSAEKTESSFIEVALPVEDLHTVNEYFSQHIPAARSIGISHLGLINAYSTCVNKNRSSEFVAILNFEPSNTALFVFNGNKLIFLRVFRTGMDLFTEEIAKLMGINKNTVNGIICENAFDVSSQIKETFKFFAHQVNLCLDFVERKEKIVIEKIKLSGSSEMISEFAEEFTTFFVPKIEMFDPFDSCEISEGAFRNFDNKRWRYAAAYGVVLGLLEVE